MQLSSSGTSGSANQTIPSRGRRTGWMISLVTFAPMAILAIVIVTTDRNNTTMLPLLDAFKTLSAIMLSFLGGIRWGMALRDYSLRPFFLVATLLPALIGWASLFLPDPVAIGMLLLAVCAMGAWDSFSFYSSRGPAWFGKIRTVMTVFAALAHGAVLLAIL